ncbi:MAG TPA: AAA family ATPase [Streptosporangiaceae bacterium]|jgi:ATP/maltotriose-dependent transcriptional regulator MalT
MSGSGGFVGREGELSRLLAALGGDARLVLVVGDAGVGKTRFTVQGMAQAGAAGVVTVRGECLPLAGALPLLPVAGALGELGAIDGGALLEGSLNAAPAYVREEAERLLPGLGAGAEPGRGSRDDVWQRERLFSAVAELLGAAARKSGATIGLVIEDVHWADSATLDCLTFLIRAGRRASVTVVATCRSDEAPLAPHVADWLAQVRGLAAMEEIRLGPLSRPEVAGQVAALAGGPVAAQVVDELYARAEGNPFFTEQLVAAGLASSASGAGGASSAGARRGLVAPAGLPDRLAELLAARAGRCGADARAVLAGLAVAGRPLTEELLAAVTGLDADAVRAGLRELAAARLLAAETPAAGPRGPGRLLAAETPAAGPREPGRLLAAEGLAGGHRPRHALLAEAVAAGLLPGERAALHARTARALALAPAGGQALDAEVAGHWQAAGLPAEELPARVAAAQAAERVFGYAEAAAHWQRAAELGQVQPGALGAAGISLPRMYTHAIDALFLSGDGDRAGVVAEEAYRRFAGYPDPADAAIVCHRAAYHLAIDAPQAGLLLMEEAVRLHEQAPPSADHATTLCDFGAFLSTAPGRNQARVRVLLGRALELAETTGATVLIPRILATLAEDAFLRGQIEEGSAFLQRGWALARSSRDGEALLHLALWESDSLLKLAKFSSAADLALDGLGPAQQAGLAASSRATVLACNAAEALLSGGHTEQAAALIDPLITGPPDSLHWLAHEARAEIDLLRGETEDATRLRHQLDALVADLGHVEFARESARRAVELAVWTGHPGDALSRVQRVLPLFTESDLTIFCGRLLAAGMRACADLAEGARARRDDPATQAAIAAADGLTAWVGQTASDPFAEHPYVATAGAERATWDAERTRLAGTSDPDAWGDTAKTWAELGSPHRAGYAGWRQAEAQLTAGQPATAAAGPLRAAATAAEGHAPLLAQIRALAERARITLHGPAPAADPPKAPGHAPYGLTRRELAVLELLTAGRTNAQIGAELFISTRTAGVHVTNILRKLGVSNRVQAAAQAERAGLRPPQQPPAGI